MTKEQYKNHRVFLGFNACMQGNAYWKKNTAFYEKN